MDKLSYALGMAIGHQLKDLCLEHLEVADFAAAVSDVLAGQVSNRSWATRRHSRLCSRVWPSVSAASRKRAKRPAPYAVRRAKPFWQPTARRRA